MDERRDQPPRQERRKPIAAAVRLSPVQQAWAEFVEHVTDVVDACASCRDVNVAGCEQAEVLYRAYRAAGDAAFEQLTTQSVRPTG